MAGTYSHCAIGNANARHGHHGSQARGKNQILAGIEEGQGALRLNGSLLVPVERIVIPERLPQTAKGTAA